MTTRLGATCWVLISGFALLLGCSGKSDHNGGFIDTSTDGGSTNMSHAGAGGKSHSGGSGGTATGGTGGSGGAGGSGGSGVSALAPKVEITSPAPASDPNVDAVLIDDQVTVVCSATKSTAKGAVAVDASTVKIAMLGSDGKELKSVTGTSTGNDDEYSAAFVLEPVPSGSVSFKCTASDLSMNTGSDTVATLVDHGPEIGIVQPEKNSAHNLAAPLAVEFDTAPTLIAKGDKQANVSGVTVTVYGVDIKATAAGGGKYKATIDFNTFDAKPSGTIPVVLTASNNRKAPGKATQSISYSIVIDGTPPAITLVSPLAQAVVGRATVLKFTATDLGAGVDISTVTVKLNDTPFVYSATNGKWAVDSTGLFTFQFGAEIKGQSDPQVTVNITGADKAGNTGMAGAIFNLDNQPPLVDLDPPNLYETQPGSTADQKQCSDYFDPVGTDAPNDKQTIVNFGRFRAIVYDQTNSKAGQNDFFYALTDRNSVQVFVQQDNNAPFLTDTDGDHICDEIWTGTAPHQKDPSDKPIPFDGMHLVAPTYRGAVTYTNAVNTPLAAACTGGVQSTAPDICKDNGSDMSVVIHHGVGYDEPVIYAIDPNNNIDSATCVGQEWDVPTAITANGGTPQLGWACVVARAVDKVGNVGVSAPLRVCLDDGTQTHRCDTLPLPSCTDNCTAPPHFPNITVRHQL